MQEIFEKIKERLKELGWVFGTYYPDGTEVHKQSRKSVAYDDVIEIVNQVAEEYKNPEQVNDCCEWTYGDDVADAVTDIYDTKCGNMHMFIGGSPSDNEYKYCPYCGKEIKVVE